MADLGVNIKYLNLGAWKRIKGEGAQLACDCSGYDSLIVLPNTMQLPEHSQQVVPEQRARNLP